MTSRQSMGLLPRVGRRFMDAAGADYSEVDVEDDSDPLYRADFEGALEAISSRDDFESYALRGKIRSLELRTAEACEHFERAEELYEEVAESDSEAPIGYFYLQLYCLENALLEEAVEGLTEEVEARQESALEYLTARSPNSLPGMISLSAIGTYKLVRRRFADAAQVFELFLALTNVGWNVELIRTGFSIGAAAAAGELDRANEAERHYETAALGLGMVPHELMTGIYCGRLHALAARWGRKRESREWLRRIEKMECPETSKECFRRRAGLLAAATERERVPFLV